MTKRKNKSEKPLTLDALATYNQEILIPAMEEHFVTKNEFQDFKNKSLTNQDAMLKVHRSFDCIIKQEAENKLWKTKPNYLADPCAFV